MAGWIQQRANARTISKVRRGKGSSMGMDLLILHTMGRRTGEHRQTPVAWFADEDGHRLMIASGGGKRHPDWYLNLAAHPDQVSIELPNAEAQPVKPHTLEGTDRDKAWQVIVAAQPRFEKYQGKSDREYPVIRLVSQ